MKVLVPVKRVIDGDSNQTGPSSRSPMSVVGDLFKLVPELTEKL